MTPCINGEKIAIIESETHRLIKAIEGNGKPGLNETVIKLIEHVKNLTDSTESLRTAFSGFEKFQHETIGEIRAKERYRTSLQWAVGTVIALTALIVIK